MIKFWLFFTYKKSSGDAVVFAASLQDAAETLMRERGIEEIFIKKRIVTAGLDQKTELIEKTFKVETIA